MPAVPKGPNREVAKFQSELDVEVALPRIKFPDGGVMVTGPTGVIVPVARAMGIAPPVPLANLIVPGVVRVIELPAEIEVAALATNAVITPLAAIIEPATVELILLLPAVPDGSVIFVFDIRVIELVAAVFSEITLPAAEIAPEVPPVVVVV